MGEEAGGFDTNFTNFHEGLKAKTPACRLLDVVASEMAFRFVKFGQFESLRVF
jgi:hypothetical protein